MLGRTHIKQYKGVNLLGFDGGGSRGVMEAMILDDLMRLVTKMMKDPSKFSNLPDLIKSGINDTQEDTSKKNEEREKTSDVESNVGQHFRKLLEEDLKSCDVIHPTEVFDMIAGTSTGSLIAFGLVCGNKKKNLEQDQGKSSDLMTVEDIIEFYRTAVKNIFIYQGRKMNCFQRIGDWLRDWRIYPFVIILVVVCVALSINYTLKYFWSSFDDWLHEIVAIEIALAVPLVLTAIVYHALKSRSQNGLEQELNKTFGNQRLGDVLPSQRNNYCIAAAVAKELTPNKKEDDILEIFDTTNPKQQDLDIKQVLKASCDAPKYFKIPVKVGLKDYVDGGVTGNCPFKEAYRQLLRIKGDDSHIETAISIAPPNTATLKIDILPGRMGKIKQYASLLNFALSYLTDGSESFKELKLNNAALEGQEKTIFVRASPISKRAKTFKMDETNIDKMISAINEERDTEPEYYEKIMDMAALTISRIEFEKYNDEHPLNQESRFPHFLSMMKSIVYDINNRMELSHGMERKDLHEIAEAITRNITLQLNEIGMHRSKNKKCGNASFYFSEALKMHNLLGDKDDALANLIRCNLADIESLD